MEAKIQKQIVDYFSFFEDFFNTSKTCLKICQNCAISINKLIHRCNNIKEANVTGTPLEGFDGLQRKLIAALHNLISDDIREIQTQRSAVEDSFESLCNKHKILLESCKEIDFTQETLIIKGTPLQPPLEQLLKFAEETITFGSEVCAQIETSLQVLAFKELNTKSIADNFKISSDWQRKVLEIIAYTSFCSENVI
ncbi:uncharacterized protein LOC123659483 isoform X2 [Melitaea cinxia]|uniref:uncharacterized protein LOC123659483 isoform X2 n=1 Tax=Melitaea cinxia TaxID=113334 RepID=UPI001E27141D|nr:uncharacterized protein LOC123659483 isoform X2 [Melitaea cinxia]